jgi:nucleoside-diphosphate-sugar epimerase
MRILVIGGTSFIGPAVVQQLSEQGHTLAVFHRGKTEAELPSGVQHIHTSEDQKPVRFLPEHVAQFRTFAPDVVVHMLLLGEQDARETLDTFRGMARRLIAISSEDVYAAFGRVNKQEPGPPDPLPITEDSPLRTHLYPYRDEKPEQLDNSQGWMDNYDKILVERVLLAAPDLPTTVLRLPMVYGPRDPMHRTFTLLKRMDDQRPAIVFAEPEARWRWTHGYVENVASAIALAATNDKASGRIYNVGETQTFTQEEWTRQIAEAAGWHGRIVSVPQERLPEHLIWGVNTEQDVVVDSTRIREELGYTEHVPLDVAMRRTIAWERANPPHEIDEKQFDYDAEDAVLSSL